MDWVGDFNQGWITTYILDFEPSNYLLKWLVVDMPQDSNLDLVEREIQDLTIVLEDIL